MNLQAYGHFLKVTNVLPNHYLADDRFLLFDAHNREHFTHKLLEALASDFSNFPADWLAAVHW